MTYIERAEPIHMVFPIWIAVDCGLTVSLAPKKLRNYGFALFEIALAVSGWLIGTWKASSEHIGIGLMVRPAAWPAYIGGEV